MAAHRKSLKHVTGRGLVYAVLIVSALLMALPFYWMVSSALKMEPFIFASPPQWLPDPLIWDNFIAVFTRIPFPRYLLNSVLVAVIVTVSHVFFDTLAGYAFAKFRFPGRDTIFFLLLLGLMVPFQVNLIPIYKIMSSLGWVDSYMGLIAPQLTSVFGIFLMRQFMRSIPDELLDAARIDGCNELGVFFRVVAPLALPGIATLIIFTFMGVWNDFLWPRLILSSNELYTLPLGLAQMQMRNTSNWGEVMAGTTVTALPMVIVFLLMQRQFISGMTEGAVKA